MIGGIKSSLAFAGVTLFGAAILAATFGASYADKAQDNGGYDDASYVPPTESGASEGGFAGSASYEEKALGVFASDEELVDDTTGFDPTADAVASSAQSANEGNDGGEASNSQNLPEVTDGGSEISAIGEAIPL